MPRVPKGRAPRVPRVQPQWMTKIQRKSAPVVTGVKRDKLIRKTVYAKNGLRRFKKIYVKKVGDGDKDWKLQRRFRMFNQSTEKKPKRILAPIVDQQLEEMDARRCQQRVIGFFNRRNIKLEDMFNEMLTNKQISGVDYRSVQIVEFIINHRFKILPNLFAMQRFQQSYYFRDLHQLTQDPKLRHIENYVLRGQIVKLAMAVRLVSSKHLGRFARFIAERIHLDPEEFATLLYVRFSFKDMMKSKDYFFPGLVWECVGMEKRRSLQRKILELDGLSSDIIPGFVKAWYVLASSDETNNSLVKFFVRRLLNPLLKCHPVFQMPNRRFGISEQLRNRDR